MATLRLAWRVVLKRTLAQMYRWIATMTLTLCLAACATAGDGTGGDDDGNVNVDANAPRPDASVSPWPDARPFADARQMNFPVDANQGGSADAPIGGTSDGGGLFCTSTAQCSSMPGTCCFSLGGPGFCVPGTEVGGICIPE